jgi:exodeoxyribonuclease VII large subunit
LDFERRFVRSLNKAIGERHHHLAQLLRILPRAESLFSGPRQRLDVAGEKLSQALGRNLQIHRTSLAKSSALLRVRILKDRMAVCGERVAMLSARVRRAEEARLTQACRHLDGLARLMDSVSHKSVLERGFALVRGEDGSVRRRAAGLKAGELLTLTFADGDAKAVSAKSHAKPAKRKPAVDQGSLF